MITISDIDNSVDRYNWWLTIMPDVLKCTSILPKETREKLDFSIESLDEIESYILNNYSIDELKSHKNKYARDLFTRYIGETFRKNANSLKWYIDLTNEKNVFYGVPVLDDITPLSPFHYCTALIDRKSGRYLRTIIENVLRSA